MSGPNRRSWLGGGLALAVVQSLPTAAQPQPSARSVMYDYLFLQLGATPGAPPRAALVQRLRAPGGALRDAGGEALGVFAPQLGWKASETAVLIGWKTDAPDREAAIAAFMAGPNVRSASRERLTPTARPQAMRSPEAGGIYVHRWFVVEAGSTDEFVSLSTQGWRDFEAKFETSIYGLFLADPNEADLKDGVRRMLLVTRYRDHGEWEKSRDPSTTAMDLFRRRGALTRDSWGASTLLL